MRAPRSLWGTGGGAGQRAAMASVNLTDKKVDSLKAEVGERLEFYDQKEPGLILRVSAREEVDDEGRKSVVTTKTWVVRYRTLDGRQPRMTLGRYPGVKLADARDAAAEAVKAARKGEDPAADRRQEKIKAQAQPLKTVEDLYAAYMEACEKGQYRPRGRKKGRARKAESTVKQERWMWEKHIKPQLAKIRLDRLDRSTVEGFLRPIAAKTPVTSNRVRAFLRQIINFAIAKERLTVNPVAFTEPEDETERTRVLTDDELTKVWKALQDPVGLTIPKEGSDPEPLYMSRPVAIALELCLLLLQRRNEVAGMRRNELFLDQAIWVIPPERAKNRRSHLVPLPPRAVALIEEALKLADAAQKKDEDGKPLAPSPVVFPSPRNPLKSITEGALSHAAGDLYAALGIEDAVLHDYRRTGATNLESERAGSVSRLVVSKLLNHTSDTGGAAAVTGRVYALHEYAAEKRKAVGVWENLLLEIVGERVRPDNVRQLREGGG